MMEVEKKRNRDGMTSAKKLLKGVDWVAFWDYPTGKGVNMAKDKDNQKIATVAGARAVLLPEQRVETTTPTPEIRRGINVLVTSDPDHPAPNPFVQGSTDGSNGDAGQSNSSNSNSKSENGK